ncbi:CPCC family cysteine-rich protein [Streptomyces sp. NPDC093248]|uniref:CPCC family cysteine-rich protein n=1 Tax=Streptomyces sp. NPDC093248 TaxID=3155072 RepID=UPI00341E5C15
MRLAAATERPHGARQDDHDADRVRGGPNGCLSLTEARRNVHAMGACDERCLWCTDSAPRI